MVIQEAPLVAVQEQPAPAVTFTLLLPPVEENEALEEESVYVQAAARVVALTAPVKLELPLEL